MRELMHPSMAALLEKTAPDTTKRGEESVVEKDVLNAEVSIEAGPSEMEDINMEIVGEHTDS